MKLLRILSFVAILGFAFTSCSKDDSNDQPTPAKKQLTKISNATTYVGESRIDTETIDLSYDSKGLLTGLVSTLKEGSEPAITKTYKIKYGDNGKMSQITQLANANTISSQVDIAYSGTQRTILATSFDDLGRASKTKVEQELNANGQPIKEQEYNFENNAWVKVNGYSVFEWSNGNLIKQTDYWNGGIELVTTCQYSDKLNNGLNKDFLLVAGDAGEFLGFIMYMNPCKNLLTKVEYTDSDKSIFTVIYKYTYDIDNYLVKSETNFKDSYGESNTTIEYTYK